MEVLKKTQMGNPLSKLKKVEMLYLYTSIYVSHLRHQQIEKLAADGHE